MNFLGELMHRLLLVGIMTLILVGMYVFKLNAKEVNTVNKDMLMAKAQMPASKKEVNNKKVNKKTKPISVKQKKKNFLKMMVGPLNRVYAKLLKQYSQTVLLIKKNPNDTRLMVLRKRYKVKTNNALLIALKPHPKSVALAQAAMESAWGTSRFFRQANNIFGVWSFNKKDKRIAAGEKRGKQTIWLRKYDTVAQSIEDYYLTLSRSKAFKGFKRLNAQSVQANPYLLVKKLDRYSERGALYGKELSSMIQYNKFTRFDDKIKQKTVADKTISKMKEGTTMEVVDAVVDNESSYSDVLSQIKADALKKSKKDLTKN